MQTFNIFWNTYMDSKSLQPKIYQILADLKDYSSEWLIAVALHFVQSASYSFVLKELILQVFTRQPTQFQIYQQGMA